MRQLKTFAIILTLVIMLAIVLRWVGVRNPTRAKTEPVRLAVPAEALNMGTVWEDDQLVWTVGIKNMEDKPVGVESFTTSCNCLAVEPQTFTIEPQAKLDLHFRIDLTMQGAESDEVSIRLRPNIKEEENGKGERLVGPEWIVRGKVRRAITLARSVYLGHHPESAQPFPPQFFPIQILAPVRSIAAKCDLAGVIASVEMNATGAALRLGTTAPFPVGPFEFVVVLHPVLGDGGLVPPRRVKCSGDIVSDVEASPQAVEIGGRMLGAVCSREVTLRSISGKSLLVTRHQAVGNGLKVERLGNGRYRVQQVVSKLGSQINRVHFYADADGRPVKVVVEVSYTGIGNNE